MHKWRFVHSVALCSAILAVPFVPICKGAARLRGQACCPNAPTATIRHLVPALVVPTPVMPTGQEQAPTNPSPQDPTAATHKVKVWTNEDLIATRTPADVYIFAKEAQAAAQLEEGFAQIASCFAFGQPEGNADETQKAIDSTMESIRDSEQAVAQARRALIAAPENLKLRNQMELAQRTAELNHAREQLWKLQEHLQEIEKSQAQVSGASKASPQ
jgi:hypothetical protein